MARLLMGSSLRLQRTNQRYHFGVVVERGGDCMLDFTATFASHYTKVVSLVGALEPEEIARYSKRAAGQKFLIDPTRE